MRMHITYTRHGNLGTDRIIDNPPYVPAVGSKVWMNWNGCLNTVVGVEYDFTENNITVHTEQ